MYSQQLQTQIADISRINNLNPAEVKLLDRSLAAYMAVLANYVKGQTRPSYNLLSISIDGLLLSDALSKSAWSAEVASGHYLVGMVFEQTGELLSRKMLDREREFEEPLNNDLWYRLLLSFMHYLTGGYRVQARSQRYVQPEAES